MRALFVDDEPRVLEGLRDLLRPHRRRWDMVFAVGMAEGLDALARGPAFDVVVTDLRMPEMDGATLLAHVKAVSPSTTRVILSGTTDEASVLRTVPVAHRFLAKPCEPAALLAVLEGAADRAADDPIRRLIGELVCPPVAPRTWPRLAALLQDPDCDLARVVAVVEEDPGVALKVLQVVNSAFFGLARPITSIQRAVAWLGSRTLHATVLAVEGFAAVPGVAPELVDQVRRHGLCAATIARRLAPTDGDAAYVAAMLQDIGRLLLAGARRDAYERVLRRAPGVSLVDAEIAEIGVAHPEAGAWLLATWGVPASVTDAVERSHRPDAWGLAGAVCAAGALADWAPGQPEPSEAAALDLDRHHPSWRDVAGGLAAHSEQP